MTEPAAAFTYSTDDGRPIKHHAAFKMRRDRCSIPDDSQERIAYLDAGWQWGQIQNRMLWRYWYDSGCTITLNNDRSETARVVRSQISGKHGLAVCPRDGDRITECDVKLAADMNFAVPTEYRASDQGYAVVAHELGHALGLSHTQLIGAYNLMTVQSPYPITGGGNVQPMRDDYEGIKFLYGDLGGRNLYVTALNTALNSFESFSMTRCRGEQFSISYAVLHNGSGAVSSKFRIFLENAATGAQTNLFYGNATTDLGFTETRTFTIPSAQPSGDYYIKWEIDPTDVVEEWNEGDNVTRSRAMLAVSAC